MQSLGAVLYLSTNKDEVKSAVEQGFPAGYLLPCEFLPEEEDKQFQIAFDFDGVIADDEAEVSKLVRPGFVRGLASQNLWIFNR